MHREILMALVAPGWTARHRRPRWAVGLLAAGLGAPVALAAYALLGSRSSVALGLDGRFLATTAVVGAVALVARIAALVELGVDERPAFGRLDVAAGVVAAVSLVTGGVLVARVVDARASLAPAFTGSGGDVLYDAERTAVTDPVRPSVDTAPSSTPAPAPTSVAEGATPPTTIVVTTTSTLPPLPKRPDSGVGAEELADVTTVLLLGGDAGPGRSGLRTDTMMLFSVHRPSGRAALVSIPRDTRRLLFPPGSALEARHPYGFGDKANAVYPIVSSQRSLRDAYAVEGVRPGVVAIAQALGYSLDVTIHDYVLVDMQGFIDLVDALGGVTVDVRKRIPMPGNVPGAPTQYPDTIGPGIVEMDGSTALGYVRSRYADSDFGRTRRQRELLAALARQISPAEVALSFPTVADAIGGTLRTSLTPDELVETLSIIGGETAIVESVGLVPPLVDIERPDWDRLAKVVGAVHVALVTGRASGY